MNSCINGGALLFGAVVGLLAFPAAQGQLPTPPSNVCVQPCSDDGSSDGGPTTNNPDNWPTTGTVYLNRDYNTQNAAADMAGAIPNGVCGGEWFPSIGRGGTGAWKVFPIAPGGEINCGWPNNWGSARPLRIFHSFTMRISRDMYERAWLAPGSTRMKFLDLAQAGGNSVNHRWVTFLAAQGNGGATPINGFQFGLASGGAGTSLVNDGRNTNPDLRAFIFDEFVWFCIVYDAANTEAFIYMKRQRDSGVRRILHRDETTVYGSEVYGNTGGGWTNAVSFAGYWDFGTNVAVDPTNNYMVVDDLVVANHWTGPVW